MAELRSLGSTLGTLQVRVQEVLGAEAQERGVGALEMHEDRLTIRDAASGNVLASALAGPDQLWRARPGLFFLRAGGSDGSSAPRVLCLEPEWPSDEEGLQLLQSALSSVIRGKGPANGSTNHFDKKTDSGSADLYFHYYGMLQHQQNMLQDYIRTGTYHAAITENPGDFEGKAVMDVGCGSGILSLFAAQAGARVVYAVEASDMAHYARQLAAANPGIGDRIKVLYGKVEEVEIPEKVDVLVSEPMGTLLVNERMIESYLYARDHHLKPGGKMFPCLGRIHLAAFSDPLLHSEIAAKAAFWQQPSFYGVDLTPLLQPAAQGYFSQVVVDQIPSNVLVSNCATHVLDFRTCTEADLTSITIPLSLQVAAAGTVHGVAAWFDVLFEGKNSQRWLSTAPGLPTTHWFQLRCVLDTPVVAPTPGCTLKGSMRLEAHSRQSYDVFITLRAPPVEPGGPPQESSGKFDLKEPYYRQLTQWYSAAAAIATTGQSQDTVLQAVAQPLVLQQAAQQQQQQQQAGQDGEQGGLSV